MRLVSPTTADVAAPAGADVYNMSTGTGGTYMANALQVLYVLQLFYQWA